MRPLLQHASRLLNASPVPPVSSPSPHGLVVQGLRRAGLSICRPCQYRAASTSPWTNSRLHPHTYPSRTWSQRSFSSSTRWRVEDDGRRSSDSTRPMAMPPPTSNTQPVAQGRVEGRAPENIPSIEGQERLQEAADSEAQARPQVKPTPTGTTTTDHVADNITRVPDEHLPSHRERQRWDFSKRFSDFMDEVLPKLAVVTQKVNTYTGTDYSGVEALRREIKEQGRLSWSISLL
jgi:sensitive to high expression protein 9